LPTSSVDRLSLTGLQGYLVKIWQLLKGTVPRDFRTRFFVVSGGNVQNMTPLSKLVASVPGAQMKWFNDKSCDKAPLKGKQL
jgi:hypothetical protein